MGVGVDKDKCIICGGCISVCPASALELKGRALLCDSNKCTNCRICIRFCPVGALELEK